MIALVFLVCGGRAHASDLATPVKYTAALMAVEFVALHALDLEDDDVSSSNFEDTWDSPAPEEDDDHAFLNYFLHPLMGSETYLRAREGELGVAGSLAFSMGASLTWEYLIESWTEHPSTQDLVLTTGVGWMIGELRYQIKQSNKITGSSNFWVDPIWTSLEYFDFNITRSNGKAVPLVGFSGTF